MEQRLECLERSNRATRFACLTAVLCVLGLVCLGADKQKPRITEFDSIHCRHLALVDAEDKTVAQLTEANGTVLLEMGGAEDAGRIAICVDKNKKISGISIGGWNDPHWMLLDATKDHAEISLYTAKNLTTSIVTNQQGGILSVCDMNGFGVGLSNGKVDQGIKVPTTSPAK